MDDEETKKQTEGVQEEDAQEDEARNSQKNQGRNGRIYRLSDDEERYKRAYQKSCKKNWDNQR